MIEQYVLGLREVDETQVAVVGGKGAQLGALSQSGRRPGAAGLLCDDGGLPAGRGGGCLRSTPCGTNSARLDPADREAVRTLSADLRRWIEGAPVPDDLGGGDHHRSCRLLGVAGGLRRALQRDRGGPADRLVRGPAGTATLTSPVGRRCWRTSAAAGPRCSPSAP